MGFLPTMTLLIDQLLFVCLLISICACELASRIDHERYSVAEDKKYILYDVNHGEGFNLRRDVYMRMANLIRVLREEHHNVILVLPPWGAIYHWQTKSLGQQMKLPWSLFFDLESLNRFVPVIEFEEYLLERGKSSIDVVYYLQAYEEPWTHWEEKWDYRPCLTDRHFYEERGDGQWNGWFFGYDDMKTKAFHCISIQGHASMLKHLILAENNTALSMMFDRAETILHDSFGDINYWKARRSMRYNKNLIAIGDEFRRTELQSDDIDDQTTIEEDWTKEVIIPGRAVGGPYLCVHWRRKDFARAHAKEVPSIAGTAKEIMNLLDQLDLTIVFLATDAPMSEIKELEDSLPENITLKRYVPSANVLEKYKDGGVAIIDQWICAHARHFTGSHVSTFTFRIQEDREMLGFRADTTFNRMCPDDNPKCERNSRWTLVQ